MNMRLERATCETVQDLLAQRGIAGHRLLVNYYGDSRSDGDPDQRRVEVEWLR